MLIRLGAPLALVVGLATTTAVLAADLPAVKLSDSNKIPECVTPGRLMVFLSRRNPKLNDKYDTIAADYMRIGNELGIRWDAAFFQMMLETGNLTYKGDVKPIQNNFAGLGATGNHVPGESFPNVATGVKAHLQHLLMYSGDTVENAVAERTRNVQEWGVLTEWQKSISGPMTFNQIAKKWAPTSRNYGRDISGIADAFYTTACREDDPRPELMALAKGETKSTKTAARKDKSKPGTVALAPTATTPEADADAGAPQTADISSEELARRSSETGLSTFAGLGGPALAVIKDRPPTITPSTAQTQPAVTIINAAQPEAEAPELKVASAQPFPAQASPAQDVATPAKPSAPAKGLVQTASVNSGLSQGTAAARPAPAKSKCRVWTASYGGQRAVIVRAPASGNGFNYTVLDVNEGAEKREAEAYIVAYAKGGEMVGEFGSQDSALNKAFELCPDE